jgi:peptidoglycan hydrolase-like protein with peptidoglycan-binding domain
MTRKLALVAGTLFSIVSAGALHAQTSSTTKPNTSSMQHTTTPRTAKSTSQDSASTKVSSKSHVRHKVWTKDQVTQAQQGLAKGGFYKGQPNGVYDRKTRSAIKAYQKSNKLPVTGRLSDSLLTKLSSS